MNGWTLACRCSVTAAMRLQEATPVFGCYMAASRCFLSNAPNLLPPPRRSSPASDGQQEPSIRSQLGLNHTHLAAASDQMVSRNHSSSSRGMGSPAGSGPTANFQRCGRRSLQGGGRQRGSGAPVLRRRQLPALAASSSWQPGLAQERMHSGCWRQCMQGSLRPCAGCAVWQHFVGAG